MARVLTPASAASRSMVIGFLPVGLDELLDPPHHRGRGQAFPAFQQVAEAVAAGMEKGESQACSSSRQTAAGNCDAFALSCMDRK